MAAKRGYTLLAECLAADTIPVRKYSSTRTGLTVIVAEVPGPLVFGSFFVATEAMDDDGLPHTLEHLIFLGSHDFPYKGTLDIISNRCLASGTNAWTDVDHTAYTVSTAGSEGFLKLLPIYLDHIFFPTLTDAGFTTEVYHVTGEGKDSGVVFCEMQGAESEDTHIVHMESQRALYKANSGYRYETGGAVCNLRYSTNNEKVRAFHKKFYCPLNTTILVVGSVEDSQLLDVCYKFEDKILKKDISVYTKAWQTPVEPLEKPIFRAITYLCDQEDSGYVSIGWQGPSLVKEYYQVVASNILFTYLTSTAASPLMKYFVETSDPFCSMISVTFIENSVPAFILLFENVAITKIPSIHDEHFKVLDMIRNNNDPNYCINSTRMKSVIDKYAQEQLLNFEKEPQHNIANVLIRDTLYGESVEEMSGKLNLHYVLKKISEEPVSFWISLLDQYYLKKPSATVLGYPWKNQQIVSTELENDMLAYRKKILGEDGLRKKAENLQEAINENKILPPDELIETVSVPRVDNFRFHPITRYTADGEEQHPEFNISASPVYTQLDDIDSKFVYAYICMNCERLPTNSFLYLPLILDYIQECPIDRDGQIISHEQVASEIERDLVSLDTSIGVFNTRTFSSGEYCSAVMMSLVIAKEKFETGLDWIRWLLYNSVFTLDRLKVVIKKLIGSISQNRRQGSFMVTSLAKLMIFNAENYRLTTLLCQQEFLTNLSKKLDTEEGLKEVIKNIEDIRNTLADPSNIILHISTNVKSLTSKCPNAAQYLSKVIPENSISNMKKITISQDSKFLSSAILKCSGDIESCVVGVATEDSYFMYHATKSIDDYYHPDLPAALVYLQYLTQLEGELWRNIRGFGLAYGYNIDINPNEGVMFLKLYRSSDIVQAFAKTKDIVLNSTTNLDSWNPLLFESAKSSLIFEVVQKEQNISNVSRQSLLTYLRRTSGDYNQKLIFKIQDVQMSDMKKIAETYIKSLFDPKISLSSIVCNNSKCEEVVEGFAALGHKLKSFSSLEESYFNPSFIMSHI